jgi:ankyrin repeat protein
LDLLIIDRFLWVVFQLDSICSQETDESIVSTLQSLPKDLPETFDRILRKLEQSKVADPRLRRVIFEVVAAAQRPLTLEELNDAISVVPGETAWNVKKLVNDMHKMLDYCGSLLVVDEEYLTVHFAHHSVKQHLLSNPTDPNVEQYRVRSLEADLTLGEICVTYLNFEVFNTQLTKTKAIPQSQSINLPSAILSGTLPRSKTANKIALRLLKARGDTKYDILPQLQEAASLTREPNKQMQQEYSFLSYAQEYWLFHSKRFERSREKSYSLWRRLVTGSVGTVKLPWAPENWANLGFAFLRWMVRNEHGALLYLIFDRLENRNAANIGNVWKILLEKGQEFNVQGKYFSNALLLASDAGHEAVVGLLVEKGAEPNSKDTGGRTPLSWAAERGHEAVVRLLVEKGAEPDSKDNDGWTPLLWAARRGHEAVARLLLEKRAEPDSKDNGGRTPLLSAADGGHQAVVRLLVEKGAELDSKDSGGRTPLWWAARWGHEAVVQQLLEAGVEPDSKSNDGRTPLWLAVERGHEAVVRLLVEKGAELDWKDSGDRTPLSWAAGWGHEAVVQQLLEAGVELDLKDNDGRTPLWLAAKRGHEAVVRLLVERGAEPDSKDNDCQTPLWSAAEEGHEAVVRLLLEAGAESDSKDNCGRTPLSRAAVQGHEAVLQQLLEKGAEPDSKDNCGRTPLWLAARRGHEAVVRLLLEVGAAEHERDALVLRLLGKEGELDSKDNGGRQAFDF